MYFCKEKEQENYGSKYWFFSAKVSYQNELWQANLDNEVVLISFQGTKPNKSLQQQATVLYSLVVKTVRLPKSYLAI